MQFKRNTGFRRLRLLALQKNATVTRGNEVQTHSNEETFTCELQRVAPSLNNGQIRVVISKQKEQG